MEHLKDRAKHLIYDLGRRGLLNKVDETIARLDKIQYPVVWYRPRIVGVMFGNCLSVMMYLKYFKSQGFELEWYISPADKLPDRKGFIDKAYNDLVQFMYDVCLEEYGIGAYDLLMSEMSRLELDELAGVDISTQKVIHLLEQRVYHSQSGSIACSILKEVLDILYRNGIEGDTAAYNCFRTMQATILVSLDTRRGTFYYGKRKLDKGVIGNESAEIHLGDVWNLEAEVYFYLVTNENVAVLRTNSHAPLCRNDNYRDYTKFEFKPAGNYWWLIRSGDYLLPGEERYFSESFLKAS